MRENNFQKEYMEAKHTRDHLLLIGALPEDPRELKLCLITIGVGSNHFTNKETLRIAGEMTCGILSLGSNKKTWEAIILNDILQTEMSCANWATRTTHTCGSIRLSSRMKPNACTETADDRPI